MGGYRLPLGWGSPARSVSSASSSTSPLEISSAMSLPAASASAARAMYRLYPNSLDVIEHVKQWGPAVILSDGDVVFQPLKVTRSGLSDAVFGRVLIYVHKEQELDDVEQRYPAEHYVLVDDKLRILTAVKKLWGSRVTTVFVRQGHYASDPKILASYPPADVSIGRIGDLLQYRLQELLNPKP